METYNIIKNEAELKNFIDILPELEKHETYYVMLESRKKYGNNLNKDIILEKFTSSKEGLLERIRKLETKKGTYVYKGKYIPENSLVLCINPTPRNRRTACRKAISYLTALPFEGEVYYKIDRKILDIIQVCKSTGGFSHFDIDTDNKERIDFSLLNTIFNPMSYHIIETRGGFHLLVDTNSFSEYPVLSNKWHILLKQWYPIDKSEDMTVPIVGCCQGDFTPKFI